MNSGQPQTVNRERALQRARKTFRIAAFATWIWGALVLGNTLLFREDFDDILASALAIVAVIALIGIGIYRGSRICIALIAAMALYTWSQLFQYFSWPEWALAILFVLAVISGFVGAVIYHRLREQQAA